MEQRLNILTDIGESGNPRWVDIIACVESKHFRSYTKPIREIKKLYGWREVELVTVLAATGHLEWGESLNVNRTEAYQTAVATEQRERSDAWKGEFNAKKGGVSDQLAPLADKSLSKKDIERFMTDAVSLYPADSRESESFVGFDYKKLKPYPCFNPKRVLVLSNGKVVLCCVDIEGEVVLGDLNKQTLKDVFDSPIFKSISKSQFDRTCKIPMCKNCSKLYIDSALSGGTLSNFIKETISL